MIMATVLEACIPGGSPLPAILESGVSRQGGPWRSRLHRCSGACPAPLGGRLTGFGGARDRVQGQQRYVPKCDVCVAYAGVGGFTACFPCN